jgi:glycosyltransferase involved in cell wall biosynthesis
MPEPAGHDAVAIFQANWNLQVHTLNVVEHLAARGHAVDLFLYNVSQRFASVNGLSRRVRVMDLAATEPARARRPAAPDAVSRVKDWIRERPRFRETIRGIRRLPGEMWDGLHDTLQWNDRGFVLPARIVEHAGRILEARRPRCCIGVECEGLIWAHAVAASQGLPCVYYSLELYTSDSPLFSGRRFRRLKRLERRAHAACAATIIQDPDRARVLFADTGAPPHTVHFVPVSVTGAPRRQKTTDLHDRLGLPLRTRIVLFTGELHQLRDPIALVRAVQRLPEDWVLVLHGEAYGDAALVDRIRRHDTGGRVRLSTTLVPPDRLGDLIASADIGLVLYSDRTINEALTGRASEKAARFAQAGLPMIALECSSFPEVFRTYGCGRAIARVDDLPEAVTGIAVAYDTYRHGAFRAYDGTYEFSRHFGPVAGWIDALERPNPAAAARTSAA